MEAIVIMGVLFGLLISTLIAAAIAYFIVRRRNGQEVITAPNVLTAYFYVMTGASIVVTSVGMGLLLRTLLGRAFDTGEPIANGVTLGIVVLVTGLVFCVSHIFGRRAFEKKQGKTANALRRVYLFFMLAIYSLAGLVAVPMAAYETAHYFINGSRPWENPAGVLATAIVVVPLWIYYLVLVLRETHSTKKEDAAQPQ